MKISELEAELNIKQSEINILKLTTEKLKTDVISLRNFKAENSELLNELINNNLIRTVFVEQPLDSPRCANHLGFLEIGLNSR